MKATDKITLTVLAVGAALAGVVYAYFPSAHWGWFLGIGLGTLIAIPKAIENAARDKVARQVLDQ